MKFEGTRRGEDNNHRHLHAGCRETQKNSSSVSVRITTAKLYFSRGEKKLRKKNTIFIFKIRELFE